MNIWFHRTQFILFEIVPVTLSLPEVINKLLLPKISVHYPQTGNENTQNDQVEVVSKTDLTPNSHN